MKNIKKISPFLIIPLFFLIILFAFETKAAAPSAITDLTCSPEPNVSGAVWLQWTVPSGLAGSNAYEVKYIQGNIMSYAQANTYNQSWPTGIAGQRKQELMTGLNPNSQFSFAMKSTDGLGNWSEMSNYVTCIAPGSTNIDDKAPISVIEYPIEKSEFLEKQTIVVKGQATDTGGSSVQKVEISLDDGKTWFLTKPKESVGTGFDWEYLWEKPIVGAYTIKTRATDWWENQETPGGGIMVIVSAPPAEKPPEKQVEKPISQMTAEELKTKIQEIQLKLIQLMTQLIQLLQQEISRLHG